MIIFCPEAFINQVSGSGGGRQERGFVKFLASELKEKFIIANETWENFRFKLNRDSENKDEAEDFIASFRSIFRPEEILLEDHQEIDATNEYTKDVMINQTENFIKRNYFDIELIITSNENIYNECSKSIPCMSVDDFFLYCMGIPRYRVLIEKYLRAIQDEKASGGY